MKQRNLLSIPLLFFFCVFTLTIVFFVSKPISFFHRAQESKEILTAGPVRGQTGDLWADFVLGQRNFNEIAPYEVVPDRLFNPGGVIIDKTVTPNILYVLDSGNNRVVGLNLEECLNLKRTNPNARCRAVKVIGQPDLVSSACNGDSGFQNYPYRAPASASSLCYIPEEAISPNEGGNPAGLFISPGGDLYLPDIHNNRLLKFNRISTADNIADEVWGQADFSGNKCNRGGQPTAESLCLAEGRWSAGVAFDSSGNLWITDSSNSRVLRYPKQPDGSISKRADLVLGQTGFNSSSNGNSLNKFLNPSALDFDSQGKLYVVDQGNDRVLIFSPSFSNGMSGQIFGGNLKLPVHIKIEKIGIGQDKIWISDVHNGMIELWNNLGTEVLKVFGKDSYRPDGSRTNNLYNFFGSFDFNSSGNLFNNNNRGNYDSDVLFWGNLSGNISGSAFRLFSPLAGNPNQYNSIGSRGFDSGRGVVVTDNQLIINDKNRILFWNNPQNLFNGRPIDGLIARYGDLDQLSDGQPNFLSQGTGKELIKKDEAGNLWVTTHSQGSLPSSIQAYQLPLATGERPIKTISFGGQDCLLNLEGERICNPDIYWSLTGLSPSSGGDFVWVSHTLTNRVFRIRNPLSNNARIDVILGQRNSSEICCNREKNPDGTCKPWEQTTKNPSLNILCHPGALSLDNFGNLYVADYYLEDAGNYRILIFRPEDLPTDNNHTLYNVGAFKEIKNIAAFDMAFDSQNLMVVGQNGYHGERSHFLAYFNDPLNQSAIQPDGYFKDYYSISFSAAFDKFNNLFVTDHNRARVLVYKSPFNSSILLHNVDHPVQNQNYTAPFNFSGWTAWKNGQRVEKVEFYLDLPKGRVAKYGEASCNEYRPDLENLAGGIYKNSGWHFSFDPAWVNQGQHKVYIYAVDDQGENLGLVVRNFWTNQEPLTPTATVPPPIFLTPTPTSALGCVPNNWDSINCRRCSSPGIWGADCTDYGRFGQPPPLPNDPGASLASWCACFRRCRPSVTPPALCFSLPPTPTPTKIPCNGRCFSTGVSSDCSTGYCYLIDEQSGTARCRNPNCEQETDCQCSQ